MIHRDFQTVFPHAPTGVLSSISNSIGVLSVESWKNCEQSVKQKREKSRLSSSLFYTVKKSEFLWGREISQVSRQQHNHHIGILPLEVVPSAYFVIRT